MKKPRPRKNDKKRLKKKEKYELKRKEVRKQSRLEYQETMKYINSLPPEEAAKLLGEDEEEFDEEF